MLYRAKQKKTNYKCTCCWKNETSKCCWVNLLKREMKKNPRKRRGYNNSEKFQIIEIIVINDDWEFTKQKKEQSKINQIQSQRAWKNCSHKKTHTQCKIAILCKWRNQHWRSTIKIYLIKTTVFSKCAYECEVCVRVIVAFATELSERWCMRASAKLQNTQQPHIFNVVNNRQLAARRNGLAA